MINLLILLLILSISLLLIEFNHRIRPYSPLKIKVSDWNLNNENNRLHLKGLIEIKNPHPKIEIMVPEIKLEPILFGIKNINNIEVQTKLTSKHHDEKERDDQYWFAYIVKSKKKTFAEFEILIKGNTPSEFLTNLENIWLKINWINYGPFGRLERTDGILIPVRKEMPLKKSEAQFIKAKDYQLLPVKTHLLGILDNPLEVLVNYTKPIIQNGDILTIGETPLAIMQGRYIHPKNIHISLLARVLCRSFHPTSSLATACGMQALVDLVGPSRVILGWTFGVLLKLVNIKGGFYRFAGEQARLIDDITGTTPPYDQTIVLGPIATKDFCKHASKLLGVAVAIVDVNDLGRVKVLASSEGCNHSFIKRALCQNPAGNANEQTPLVLIRPS